MGKKTEPKKTELKKKLHLKITKFETETITAYNSNVKSFNIRI